MDESTSGTEYLSDLTRLLSHRSHWSPPGGKLCRSEVGKKRVPPHGDSCGTWDRCEVAYGLP